jgi:hypothetical protein
MGRTVAASRYCDIIKYYCNTRLNDIAYIKILLNQIMINKVKTVLTARLFV